MNERKEPDARVKRYLQWYALRLTDEPEDRILRELKGLGLGEFVSSQALHTRLANGGR
ncbi:MAG TPA: hypothetical protein VGR18_04910 [Rubrobacter sp.]|nr:hypothetical protein [Rubrobacter sp.]